MSHYISFQAAVYFGGRKIASPLYESGLADDDEVAASQLLNGNRIANLSEALSLSPRALEGLKQDRSLNEYSSSTTLTTVVDSNETLLAYLRMVVDELSLLRKLHYSCIRARQIKATDLPALYDLLMLASDYYDMANTLTVSNQPVSSNVTYTFAQRIAWPESNHASDNTMTNIASNLVSLFNSFRVNADAKYGKYTIISRGTDNIKFKINYWSNILCQADLRADLWSFASQSYIKNPNAWTKMLKEFDTAAISETFLSVVNTSISDILSSETDFVLEPYPSQLLQLHARTHRAVDCLFLYLDIIDAADYRTCVMCDRLFRLGSQKSKIYCDRHSRNAKRYFKRKYGNTIYLTADKEEDKGPAGS